MQREAKSDLPFRNMEEEGEHPRVPRSQVRLSSTVHKVNNMMRGGVKRNLGPLYTNIFDMLHSKVNSASIKSSTSDGEVDDYENFNEDGDSYDHAAVREKSNSVDARRDVHVNLMALPKAFARSYPHDYAEYKARGALTARSFEMAESTESESSESSDSSIEELPFSISPPVGTRDDLITQLVAEYRRSSAEFKYQITVAKELAWKNKKVRRDIEMTRDTVLYQDDFFRRGGAVEEFELIQKLIQKRDDMAREARVMTEANAVTKEQNRQLNSHIHELNQALKNQNRHWGKPVLPKDR